MVVCLLSLGKHINIFCDVLQMSTISMIFPLRALCFREILKSLPLLNSLLLLTEDLDRRIRNCFGVIFQLFCLKNSQILVYNAYFSKITCNLGRVLRKMNSPVIFIFREQYCRQD